MTSKKYIITSFSLVLLLFFGWHLFRTGNELYHYSSLSAHSSATIDHLEVVELKKNLFKLKAHYTYLFDGLSYKAESFMEGSYPNPWAAEAALKKWEKKELTCWFSPQKYDQPSLIKKFPLLSLVYTTLLAAILLYFGGMIFYLRKKWG